ncbi:hypothetical protein JCM16303_003705 [Sporobolomyces ruberrimus]
MNAHHKKSSYRPPPPRNPLHFSSSTLQLPLDREQPQKASQEGKQLWRAIERIPFGCELDILIPGIPASGSQVFVDNLQHAVGQATSYQVARGVNLADLLEPNFLNSFVRKGSLVAISLDAAEEDDVVVIDGRGRLILSVCKDTYELLGLPGRASMHGSFRQRFIIEVSLVDPAFRAGKPGFERVKRLLRDWPKEPELFEQLQSDGLVKGGKTFDLVMAYTDAEDRPQQIDLPESVTSSTRTSTVTSRELDEIAIPTAANLPVPEVEPTTPNKRQRTSSGALRRTAKDDEVWWDAFKEWRGLASLGAGENVKWRSKTADEEEDGDEWGIPRDECERGSLETLTVNGLLHPKTLSKVVRDILSDPSFSSIPFVSLVLRPFPHSPISHTSKENPPVVGTGVRPNGKKRKRGRGRGEEEEANRERLEDVGGWEIVLRPRSDALVDWWMWEGQ